MNRGSLFLIVLAALLLIVPVAQAQDAPPQINDALADLSNRLGRPLTLDTIDAWRYVADRYTDSALGCPLVTPQPVPEGIVGYTFELVVDGVTYDYRVSADRAILFPCDAGLLQVAPPEPATPAPDVPDVEVTPAPGEACPPGFEGLLAPRLTPNMRGEVIGAAPSRLRNGPSLASTQIALINPGTVFEVTGGPICADAYVWWQVVVNGQAGWMAEGTPPDAYFLASPTADATSTPAVTTVPLPTLQAQLSTPVIIQTGNLPRLAALPDNLSLTLFDIEAPSALTELVSVATFAPETSFVVDMAWSPDGRYLAYTVFDPEGDYNLYLTDIAGSEPVLLADDLYAPLPVTFSVDGSEILYVAAGSDDAMPTEDGKVVSVYSQGLTPDAPRRLRGTFNFGVGCGGGSPYPADSVYWTDAGLNGRGLVFRDTPYGLVFSTDCAGGGTALLNLQTDETIELGTNLSRVDIAPDGRGLVGVRGGDQITDAGVITLIDLETLDLTPLGAAAEADQVAWASPTEIFYSVRTDTGTAVTDSDSAALADIGLPEGVPVYTLALHRIDLAATTDSEIWTGAGYAISRLYAAPDGSGLYFNVVPNGDAWVAAVNAGSLDIEAPWAEHEAYFAPTLYRLALETGDAEALGEGLYLPTFNDAAFIAAEDGTVG